MRCVFPVLALFALAPPPVPGAEPRGLFDGRGLAGWEFTANPGVAQNRITGCSLREGKIGFQFEGTPFELRHVTLVGLD